MSISDALVAALQALLAAAGSSPVRPNDTVAAQCVPTNDDVNRRKSSDAAGLRADVKAYLQEVKARYGQAQGAGLLAHLGNLEQASGRPCLELRSYNCVEDFARRLSLTSSSSPVRDALDLVQQTNVDSAADYVVATASDTVELIQQLRNLDDILIRLLAAKAGADGVPLAPGLGAGDVEIPGATLAEMLALYRAEGDLGVPRSLASLQRGIPPGPSKELTSLSNDGSTVPNIARLVLLGDANAPGSALAALKDLAVMIWMVQIAGLDLIARQRGLRGNVTYQQAFGEVTANARGCAMGTVQSRLTQQTAWQQLMDDMNVQWVGRDGSGTLVEATFTDSGSPPFTPLAVRMVPGDPEKLISTALIEAAYVFRSLSMSDQLLGSNDRYARAPCDPSSTGRHTLPSGHPLRRWVWPAPISYAIYNLQVGYLDRKPYESMLVSAIAHGYLNKKPIGQRLTQEVNADAAMKAQMDDLVTKPHNAPRSRLRGSEWPMFTTDWPRTRAWLRSGGRPRIALLNDYFRGADLSSGWRSWNKTLSVRANADRYRQLYEYYHQVTSEARPFG